MGPPDVLESLGRSEGAPQYSQRVNASSSHLLAACCHRNTDPTDHFQHVEPLLDWTLQVFQAVTPFKDWTCIRYWPSAYFTCFITML
ncbi:hypothetical protein CesoFtcFv8_018549 [Champsocephalus esox]|uniref:Uncharacterized protein n=1 Tax=Champsocephalus esox TaxID=159716 RepID=A0AAN8BHQ9_9TELE|nr:hypothetical protein CesoFtcFv8_018549 [Champsocephalus esox]